MADNNALFRPEGDDTGAPARDETKLTKSGLLPVVDASFPADTRASRMRLGIEEGILEIPPIMT